MKTFSINETRALCEQAAYRAARQCRNGLTHEEAMAIVHELVPDPLRVITLPAGEQVTYNGNLPNPGFFVEETNGHRTTWTNPARHAARDGEWREVATPLYCAPVPAAPAVVDDAMARVAVQVYHHEAPELANNPACINPACIASMRAALTAALGGGS